MADASPLRALALAALLFGLPACHRSAPDSSEYEEAFTLYSRLYVEKLDDCYGDPQMKRVLTLLGQVDPASSRAAEAKELQAKVEQGVADFQKRQEKVLADEKAAEAPSRWPNSTGDLAPPPAAPAPAPSATGPALGMTRDDFLGTFGACFELKGVYQQGSKQGEAYAVKAACATKYPAQQGSLVVLLDGRVSRQVALSEVTSTTQSTASAEAAPAAPLKPAQAPAAPPPPKAIHWLPGAPHPQTP